MIGQSSLMHSQQVELENTEIQTSSHKQRRPLDMAEQRARYQEHRAVAHASQLKRWREEVSTANVPPALRLTCLMQEACRYELARIDNSAAKGLIPPHVVDMAHHDVREAYSHIIGEAKARFNPVNSPDHSCDAELELKVTQATTRFASLLPWTGSIADAATGGNQMQAHLKHGRAHVGRLGGALPRTLDVSPAIAEQKQGRLWNLRYATLAAANSAIQQQNAASTTTTSCSSNNNVASVISAEQEAASPSSQTRHADPTTSVEVRILQPAAATANKSAPKPFARFPRKLRRRQLIPATS